jgi:uncharacterized 2Fe-2S/4Fe-4S cluster protein (DUF4445 family)
MKIKVQSRAESFDLTVNAGSKLLEYLQHADIPVNAACGGSGTCTKCRVKIQNGFVSASKADQKAFSPGELAQGWRLSCQAIPRTNIECIVPDVESFNTKPRVIVHSEKLAAAKNISRPVLACDLGSTGIVVAIGDEKGNPLVEAHLLNRQVRYGADVMTRLKFAQERGSETLQQKLFESLELCVNALNEKHSELYEKANKGGLYCSGNSALVSFLHAWNISSLAVYPFQPLQKESFSTKNPKLDLNLTTLPLMAGFVGADTYAGVFYLVKKIKPAEPWMLVDIGTNTEIVINNGKGELYFSSAPAGPAFEGGNITQGMRAEPGAIAHAEYKNEKWMLETIGNDKPRGICGSGLIDALFQAVQFGLIHRDGFVPDGRMYLNDDIALNADDVREFQLAKSATRTAVDLLMNRAGARPKKIYLAGTFAQHLVKESVVGTGLLPLDISLEFLGNSSLMGTLLYAAASESDKKEFQADLDRMMRPIELALQDDFQDAFVKNLNF